MPVPEAPNCFGSEWDPKAAECLGGYDAGFTSPNGSHTRPKCDFFDQCKVRTQLAKANVAGQLIPPSALLQKPPAAQPPPPSSWNWYPPPAQQPLRQPPAPQQPGQPTPQPPWQQGQNPLPWQPPPEMQQMMQWMQQTQQQMPPWMARNPYAPPPVYPGQFPVQGQISPIQMMSTNYEMPAYLTVPEEAGGSFWEHLFRNLIRGMGKALGHTLANFFDRTPIKR